MGILILKDTKKFWLLLQDRDTKKVTFEKCDKDWGRCVKDFDEKTVQKNGDENLKSRGVMLRGTKEKILRFSKNEDNLVWAKHWSTHNQLYGLVGELIVKNQESDFDTLYVPDETTAGFELSPPLYPQTIYFNAIISWKRSETYT